MRARGLWAILCLLLGALHLGRAYDPSGRCEAYSGPPGLCDPPPALIHVNATFGQTQAAENVQSLLRFTSLVSTECARDAIAFLCASNFQQCVNFNYTDTSGMPASAALAIPPCASVCAAVASSCAVFFAQAAIALPDCALYPLNVSTEDIPPANQTVDLDCEPARNFSATTVTCFEPFLFPIAGRVTTAATMAWLAFLSLRNKVGSVKDKLLSALGAQWRLGVFGTMVVFPYFLLIADSNVWPISRIVGLYFEYLACTYAGQGDCRLRRFPASRAYLEVSSYLYIGLLIFLCFTVRLNYIEDAWRVLRTFKRRKDVQAVNMVEMSTSGSI